jgi:hypothetical protein
MTNGTLAWFAGNKENARRKKPEFVFEKVLDFLSLL